MTPRDELRELVAAVCDESATTDQFARLEQFLRSDPAAEAYYVQMMSQQADLATHFAPPTIP
ncbi:MAG: hypothetical protein ACRC7O_07045, partial [Fimbriiglobus sp.]